MCESIENSCTCQVFIDAIMSSFLRSISKLYKQYRAQTIELERIRILNEEIWNRRKEFERSRDLSEEQRRITIETLKEQIESVEDAHGMIESEKMEISKVVERLGEISEKKIRENLRNEEFNLGKRASLLEITEKVFNDDMNSVSNSGRDDVKKR